MKPSYHSSPLATSLISDLVPPVQRGLPKHGSQPQNVEVLQIFQFSTLHTLALWPLHVVSLGESLLCRIEIIHQRKVENILFPTVIIRTTRPEMVTQPSPTVLLLVSIVAR